jgi:hypothetical protein
MKSLPFEKIFSETGEFYCKYTVPRNYDGVIINLMYGEDILHETVFNPAIKPYSSWVGHSFLKMYPGKEIRIVQDYFAHKGEESTELHYIHIPKCGGSTIENTGYEWGVRWSKWHETPHSYHSPSNYFMNNPDLIKDKVLFTTVRNPYDRILSLTYCPFNLVFQNRSQYKPTKDEFNVWVSESIIKSDTMYDFVYYKDKKVIPHVIKLENLKEEFDNLMFNYNTKIRINKSANIGSHYYSEKRFGLEDISKENIDWINKKFEKDFIYFNYDKI